FYGDNLFTTEQEIRDNPARVEALRAASLRGWQYAMAHPEEIADLIVAKYSQQHEREFYLFEAKQMAALLRTDLIEIGYMNPGRWRHIADTYADLGLLAKNSSLDGFIYNVKVKRDLTWLYIGCLLLAIVSGVTFYIHRINRRLSQALVASKKDHELLLVSEERHRLLADNATDVIWMMSLDGRFTYVSPSVEKLRGYTSDEVMQQSLAQVFTATSIPIAEKALSEPIAAMAMGQAFVEFRGELEQPCKDGSTVWTEVTTSGMKNSANELIGILGVARNITERKQIEDQVRQYAFYDNLTKLPNRRLLNDRLSQMMAVSKRSACYSGLMFLDLDNFKPLNDKYGHAVGDMLLLEVANRLKNCVRETDTVARFGGDEFVVLVGDLMAERTDAQAQAKHIAEKIRSSLAQAYSLTFAYKSDAETTVEHHCTVSIGVALLSRHDANEDDILKWADTAMYQAKAAGRNQICFYDGTTMA
ncbi:MAG: diguanylate cyclase, partial [Burkholderiaceae bacterium]|nr:diguanylate cyclase [Burkholderiaceae bacterium]